MISPINIFQGDDMELILVRPDITDPLAAIDDNWVCEIAVMDSSSNIVIAKRAVEQKTDDNLYFLVGLTSAESASLAFSGRLGCFVFAIQLKNNTLSPAYCREKHLPLYVEKQVVI